MQNLNYVDNPIAHGALFAWTVATQASIGEAVSTVTITLGSNNLAALARLLTDQALAAIPEKLAACRLEMKSISLSNGHAGLIEQRPRRSTMMNVDRR